MSRPTGLCAVVLNYRTADLTIECLRALVPGLREVGHASAVVVDNASGDGSAEQIGRAIESQGWGDLVELVSSPVNGGFSSGNNLGMRHREAEAYLLLNSDTLVRPGAVAVLLEAMRCEPRAGIIGPRLEWPDGEPQVSAFRDISPASELIRAAGTGPITRRLRRYDVPIPVRESSMRVDWVSFAACLVRREVVEQIGPMDEGYFMYFEDVDYCRRARERGWDVLYWPAARVVHLRGGTSPVKSQASRRERLPRYYYQSRARCLRKRYGLAGLWAANVLWLTGHVLATVRRLFGKPSHACRGEWRDIWVGS